MEDQHNKATLDPPNPILVSCFASRYICARASPFACWEARGQKLSSLFSLAAAAVAAAAAQYSTEIFDCAIQA